MEERVSIVAEQIASLRERLLDLTSRNRLLNFTHGRTSCLRFADVLADQVFEELLRGVALTTDAVLWRKLTFR